jgi:hypothetical protein
VLLAEAAAAAVLAEPAFPPVLAPGVPVAAAAAVLALGAHPPVLADAAAAALLALVALPPVLSGAGRGGGAARCATTIGATRAARCRRSRT